MKRRKTSKTTERTETRGTVEKTGTRGCGLDEDVQNYGEERGKGAVGMKSTRETMERTGTRRNVGGDEGK